MEYEKKSFLYSYLANYDNSIRIAVADELDNAAAVVTIRNIDFISGKADILFGKLRCYEEKVFQNITRNIINWAKSHIGLKDLIIPSRVNSLLEGTNNISANAVCNDNIPVSDYCIIDIIDPWEKKYILKYFDKFMYIPISTREDYERVVLNISSAADMLLAYNRNLLGFVAFYDNDVQGKKAYISSIAIDSKYRRRGIAKKLFNMAKDRADAKGMEMICLEVNSGNTDGIKFYNALGMSLKRVNGSNIAMEIEI